MRGASLMPVKLYPGGLRPLYPRFERTREMITCL